MSMADAEQLQSPECEKLVKVAPQSQAIGAFIDWMREQGWMFAKFHSHDNCVRGADGFWACGYYKDECEPDHRNIETLLAEFFKIDMNKVEQERRAILEAIQK